MDHSGRKQSGFKGRELATTGVCIVIGASLKKDLHGSEEGFYRSTLRSGRAVGSKRDCCLQESNLPICGFWRRPPDILIHGWTYFYNSNNCNNHSIHRMEGAVKNLVD
jgi:hypothetical protein